MKKQIFKKMIVVFLALALLPTFLLFTAAEKVLDAMPEHSEQLNVNKPTTTPMRTSYIRGAWGENLSWELNVTTGELVIVGVGEMDYFSSSTDDAWRTYKHSIQSVVIKDGVTSIGMSAFRDCTSLTSINIPNSVTSIGSSAFYHCTSLTSINIPNSVIIIGADAFYDCTSVIQTENGVSYVDKWIVDCDASVTSVVLSTDTRGIGYAAFRDCTSLTCINIPDSVMSIGENAFRDCTSLTNVTLGNGVERLGWSAFFGCTALTSVEMGNNLTSISDYAFYGCTSLTNINIPDSVTDIAAEAFYACRGIIQKENGVSYVDKWVVDCDKWVTTVALRTNTRGIGEDAFCDCTLLTSVTIPDNVTNIGANAFGGCSSLKRLFISDIAAWCNIEFASMASNPLYYGAVVSFVNTELYLNNQLVTSLVIPYGITEIKDYTFFGCGSLTNVTIPDSVTSIGKWVFYLCKSMKNVTIGDGVTSIGEYAFPTVPSLTNVYISDIVAWCNITFGNTDANPLYFAKNLYLNNGLVTNLHIPDGVTSIKDYAFYDCNSLTSITIPDSVTTIGDMAFDNCTSLKSIVIGNGVTSIENFAFRGCISLTSIIIPNSVTSMGALPFSGCTSLLSVTIGNGVKSIGDDMFKNFTSLTSVTLGNGIESIGNYAFSGCKALTSITLGNGVESIGNYAFAGCEALTSITIPDSVTTIGNMAFNNCSSLTGIEIPDSVMSIGDSAFRDCTSLMSVTIGNGVTSIGEYAFYDCDALTSVTIGNGVTSIGEDAFGWSKALTRVYISDISAWCSIDFANVYSNPLHYAKNLYLNNELVTNLQISDGVTSIKNYAFDDCTSLTSIEIPDSVMSIGDGAFRDCTSLMSVTIGNGVTSIGEDAFARSNALTRVYISDISAWCSIDFANVYSNPLCYAKKLYLNNELVKNVQIPEGVTSIKNYAFYNCTSLTNVTLGNGVESIGNNAFQQCTSLKKIIFCGTEEQWNSVEKGEAWLAGNGEVSVVFHDYVPTKTDSDISHDIVCTICGDVKESVEHNWDDGTVATPATHTTVGEKAYTCTDCGATKTEEIPMTTEHNYGEWQQHNADQHKRICECGDVAYDEHTYGAWQRYDADQHKHICECGEVRYASHAWNNGETTTSATHMAKGVKTYTCTSCGETRTEEIPMLTAHVYSDRWQKHSENQHKQICPCGQVRYASHNWNGGVITTSATHTTTGVKTFTCTDCRETYTETVAKTETHSYGPIQWHNTTQHKRVCACGVEQYADHLWYDGEIVTPATHTAEGVKSFTCIICSQTKTEKIPMAEEHAYGSWQKHTAEQHKKVCECDDVQYGNHTWNAGVVTTAPTEATEGVKTYTCVDCDATKTEVLAKLPASSGDNDASSVPDNTEDMPEDTTAASVETTPAPETTAHAAERKGCRGALNSTYAILALVAILGFAFVAKKKENN